MPQMKAREKTLKTEMKSSESKNIEQKQKKVLKGSVEAKEWGQKMKKLREEKKQKNKM